ncbi:MAG: hypothetical protein JWR11_3532 [Mycobacterium sp.]|jgi:hypothetical protein|nr:hypothetical protein [Mycobacterium sp.]MDT5064051.1 hypothetical protein [Mycobacterium sp.]MDT5179704.1 hypothetical protein [Mycobacterium sp.]
MTAFMVSDLTDAIRHLGADAASQRDAQLLLARRLIAAGRGSIPSTANVLGWMTTAFGIAAATVLDAGAIQSAGVPRHVPHGFTVVDRSITRC